MRFRETTGSEWHLGRTDNISDSGVAIHTDDPVAPSASVVFVISLPPIGSAPGGRLSGAGRVVRQSTAPAGTPGTSLAIAIEHYRIDRGA